MLHIAYDNVKIAQDRAHIYIDHNRHPCFFIPCQKVFLLSFQNAKTLYYASVLN